MITSSTYDRRTSVDVLLDPEDTQDINVVSPVLSAWDVEAAVAQSHPNIIFGSLRFVNVVSLDPKVVAAFLVAQTDGSMIRGHVLVNSSVDQDKVTVGLDVRVTGVRRARGG